MYKFSVKEVFHVTFSSSIITQQNFHLGMITLHRISFSMQQLKENKFVEKFDLQTE